MIKGLIKYLPVKFHENYIEICKEMNEIYPDMSDPKTAHVKFNNFVLFKLSKIQYQLDQLEKQNKENKNGQ